MVRTAGSAPATVVALAIDNYGSMSWNLMSDGHFLVQDLDTGKTLDRLPVVDGEVPRSWAFAGPEGKCVFGFADGSVVLAEVTFATEYLEDEEVPPEYLDLEPGQRRIWKNGSLERTPEGQLRFQVLEVARDDAVSLGDVRPSICWICPAHHRALRWRPWTAPVFFTTGP